MWVGGLMEGGRTAPWVPSQLDPPGVLRGARHLHSLMWVLASLEVLAAVRTVSRAGRTTSADGAARRGGLPPPEEAGPRGAKFSHHEMKPRETGLPKTSLTGPLVWPWVGGKGDPGHRTCVRTDAVDLSPAAFCLSVKVTWNEQFQTDRKCVNPGERLSVESAETQKPHGSCK